MRSFIDGNVESDTNGLIQEQLGASISPKAAPTSAPPTIGTEVSVKASTYDLEHQLNENEIIRIKVEMSEEIQRRNSDPTQGFFTMHKKNRYGDHDQPMAKRLDWSFLRAKCLLCGHLNCPACREVSFSNLACCQCRARAIKRLLELQELQNKEGDKG